MRRPSPRSGPSAAGDRLDHDGAAGRTRRPLWTVGRTTLDEPTGPLPSSVLGRRGKWRPAIAPVTASARYGLHTYGVVVVMAVNPIRSRMGRLSSVASTWRYRVPRRAATRARWATRAR